MAVKVVGGTAGAVGSAAGAVGSTTVKVAGATAEVMGSAAGAVGSTSITQRPTRNGRVHSLWQCAAPCMHATR